MKLGCFAFFQAGVELAPPPPSITHTQVHTGTEVHYICSQLAPLPTAGPASGGGLPDAFRRRLRRAAARVPRERVRVERPTAVLALRQVRMCNRL